MRQRARVHGEVISVDIGAWFAIASFSFSIAKRLNYENESHANRSEKAKPTASPALKNRLFLV
jgi:hypothetical protein